MLFACHPDVTQRLETCIELLLPRCNLLTKLAAMRMFIECGPNGFGLR